MKNIKIIISVFIITACCGFAAGAGVPDDEFNPVDVISTEDLLIFTNADLLIPANLLAMDTPSTSQFKLPKNETTQQLWETTIASIDENDVVNKADLQQMIDKIKSFKIQKVETVPNPQQNTAKEPQQPVTENTQTNTAAKQETVPPTTEPITPVAAVISEINTADKHKEQTENLAKIETGIDRVQKPYEMAEILFRAGHLRQACTYYKQALKVQTFEKSPQDKAWILFQIANCLRTIEPEEAGKFYTKLIAEHPDSTWINAARQYNELLTMQIQNKPQELINEQADDLKEAKENERR